MKPLLRIILLLAVIFASTFVIIRLSGVLTEDDIKAWLEAATNINPWYVALAVVLILAIDIFIAVPTLTTCILSGYFLGFIWGGLAASIGLLSAGLIGYWLSRSLGEKVLKIIICSSEKREEAKETFGQIWIGYDYAEPKFAHFLRSVRLYGRDGENEIHKILFGMVYQ
jgi:uncharacterized membrane protein YdjX (TVP38/TMEM64 family)